MLPPWDRERPVKREMEIILQISNKCPLKTKHCWTQQNLSSIPQLQETKSYLQCSVHDGWGINPVFRKTTENECFLREGID